MNPALKFAPGGRISANNLVRFGLATFAGSIVLFIAGYAIWGFLLGDYFAANESACPGLSRQPPSLVMLFASNVIFALLLTLVIERWAGVRTPLSGLAAGGIVGVLIHLGFELSTLGYMNLYRSVAPVLVDVIAEAARTALAGAVVSVVLGWHRQATAP
jgi:hypothetical protein